MLTRICDRCKRRTEDFNRTISVKMEGTEPGGFGWAFGKWREIDLCAKCFDEIWYAFKSVRKDV